TVNKNTGYAPYELYYEKSIFCNLDLDIDLNCNKVKNMTREKRKRLNNLMKKTEVPVNYKCGDKVFIKNHTHDKMSPRWLGPYTVIGISKNINNLTVETESNELRVSIKNCRLSERGDDVVYCSATTQKFENSISERI
ncbi:Pol polyprotein, partial [Dictyocoela muelleri]